MPDANPETRTILRGREESKSSAIRSALIVSALLLALTIAGSVGVFIEGANGLRDLIEQNQPPDRTTSARETALVFRVMESWLRQIAVGMAGGVAGLTVIGGVALLWWRSRWQQRLKLGRRELAEEERRHRKSLNDLARRSAECRRIEEELLQTREQFEQRVDERTSELAESTGRLQAELDSRRHAERLLAEQAKELERSKDVLEMHVQLRTAELQKLQQLYESILNSAGEGIYGLDLDGRTTFVNLAAAKMACAEVEDLIGKTEQEAFLGDFAESTEQADGAASPAVIFRRWNGTTFPAEYVRTPIEEEGCLVGEVVVFKDITERRRAEEALSRKAAELARSNAELEQFAYVASHDLQEPLRKIQAFGDRLKVKCEASLREGGRDYLERMQSASARMQTLINDLLTFSRVISASRPFVSVDLGAVAREVLNDLELRIEQTGGVVEVGELPTIQADPLQMRQLLLNLVSNALKFQPPDQKPVVRIFAEVTQDAYGHDEDEVCELTVQDNGIGFEEKYLDKIFAVFQRLHGRDRFEGTGVGLAVCRRITDRHGGTITARSRPGEGASFVVRLPVRHTHMERDLAA